MNFFEEPSYEISKIDENEIKMKDIIKKAREDCDIAITGIPFDGATFGRQGAKYAPKYIREALYNLNTYSYVEDFSLENLKICDFGDIITSNSDLSFSYKNIEEASLEIYRKSKLAIFIGGDHSITYSTLASLSKLGSVSFIVLDAHHDIRKVREKFSSSGTYLRKTVEELSNVKKIFQIGIRDFYNSRKYAEMAKSYGLKIYFVEDIRKKGIDEIFKEIEVEANETEFSYLSIDMDCIEQAQGVNSPSVNGIQSSEAIDIVRKIAKLKNLKAIDVVEVAPLYEQNRFTVNLAAYLILVACTSFFSREKGNIHS